MIRVIYIFIITSLFFQSCGLDVINNNEPDTEKVLLDKNDVEQVANSLYLTYWRASHNITLQLPALVAADQFTASWGNFGWQQISAEPRITFNNTVEGAYNNNSVTEGFYYNMYAALSQTNDVLKKLKSGTQIGKNGAKNAQYLALCYHLQGVIMGQIALTFDQGFVLTEYTSDKSKPIPYKQLMDTAIAKLWISSRICDTAKFTFTEKENIINGLQITNKNLSALNHSYIARFFALNSRDKLEDEEPSHWDSVQFHVDLGIGSDFAPKGEGLLGRWTNTDFFYFVLEGWARVDCRLLNLMDPMYPKRYPKDSIGVVHPGFRAGVAKSDDNRFDDYFEFQPSINFDPNRGKYHFSNYRYKRYDNSIKISEGSLIEFRSYELNLYDAESSIKSNKKNLKKAIAILDFSSLPRLSRNPSWLGRLSKPGTTEATVLNAIFYERDIELLGQGFLVGFCDMRRRDMLQKGTPLHFPIPGKELETLKIGYYTFGGSQNVGKPGTSNAGWLSDDDYNK